MNINQPYVQLEFTEGGIEVTAHGTPFDIGTWLASELLLKYTDQLIKRFDTPDEARDFLGGLHAALFSYTAATVGADVMREIAGAMLQVADTIDAQHERGSILTDSPTTLQ